MSGNNVITNFVSQASDARDQADHVSSDLFGNTHSQGVLTLIVRTDTREMKARQKQIGSRYPGGSDPYCLHVHEFDIIIGPKGTGTGGRDFVWGFSSLNGLPFGTHKNIDSLEQSLWFVGVSRSNHYTVPDLAKGIQIDKQGFAAITFGICSIRRKWTTDIYPGDRLVWRLPSLREAKEIMSRKTTTRHPSDKLMAIVEPLDWSFLKYAWKNVCQLMLRSGNDIGISHRLGNGENWGGGSGGGYGRINSDVAANVRTARALKDHTLTVVSTGVEVLAMRGLVDIQTPYKKKKHAALLKLTKAVLDFAKTKVTQEGGGMLQAALRAAIAGMDIEGKKVGGGLTLGSPEIRNANNSVQSKFLKAYLEYSEACAESKTDASTLTNCDFEDEFKRPYLFFSQNKDLSKLYATGMLSMVDPNSTSEAKKIDTDAKLEKINNKLFLDNYLGLVNGGKGEQVNVTHDILNATHIGFGEASTGVKYLTGYPLGSELNIYASQRQLNMLQESKTLLEEHLFKLNEEMSKLSQSIEDRKIGTAVSHATAGSLDTILDISVKV